MKFQNPSFNFFFERTDARISRKQYAPHFFKVGGIKIRRCVYHVLYLSQIIENYTEVNT